MTMRGKDPTGSVNTRNIHAYMLSLLRLFALGLSCSVIVVVCLLYRAKGSVSLDFAGKGTEQYPYLIESVEQLKLFRDEVNSGNDFEGMFFLQTTNIDLNSEEWMPIGIYSMQTCFRGVYDGGGHYVSNLVISSAYPYEPANVGFFGRLGGTVKNFGIESGRIEGDYCGSIVSHSSGEALILNCYNKADVIGTGRAGGICDNFSNGSIINCTNLGKVSGPSIGEIVSYSADLVSLVYPETMPGSFKGEYIGKLPEGSSIPDRLNAGLQMLLKEGVLKKKDITWWG